MWSENLHILSIFSYCQNVSIKVANEILVQVEQDMHKVHYFVVNEIYATHSSTYVMKYFPFSLHVVTQENTKGD